VKARKKAESGKALTAQSPSASPMYRASPRQIAGGLINRLGRFRFFEKPVSTSLYFQVNSS